MINPNFKVGCKSTSVEITPSYPAGATNFRISLAPATTSINNTTGKITFNISTPGIYRVAVTYDITVGEVTTTYTETFIIQVVDCAPVPTKTNYIICVNAGSTQFPFVTTPAYSDYEFDPAAPSGFSISTGGTITALSDGISPGEYTMTIKYNGGANSTTITVNVVACDSVTASTAVDCERESIAIVWESREGGRSSYWFNQHKLFKIEMKDGQTFVNASREERLFTQGRVNEAVQINEDLIPKDHVDHLETLQTSIQAWVTTDIADQSKYKAILIRPKSFNKYKSNDRFYEVSFQFLYAKNILIQNQ